MTTPFGRPIPSAKTLLVQRAFNEMARHYDDTYRTKTHRAEDSVTTRLLLEAIPELGKSSLRVLDLGCGTGLLLEYVYLDPMKYLGVDVSDRMLRRFRDKFPHHAVTCHDMEQPIPTHQNRHDVAVSLYGGMSYVGSLGVTLETAYAHLAPGGRLFAQVYGRRRLARREGLDVLMLQNASFFSAHDLHSLAICAGFQDVQVVGMSALGHRMPGWATQGTMSAYLWAEHRLFGRRYPDACTWLVVTGRKP